MSELRHHQKIRTQRQKSPSNSRPLHRLRRSPPSENIYGTLYGNDPLKHDRPLRLRGSSSDTEVSPRVGPQTSHSTRVWESISCNSSTMCRGGRKHRAGRENDGQILLKWTTPQGLHASNPSLHSLCNTFRASTLRL